MQPNSKVDLFENIALSFSGGGFRAASFCLGALSYLNHFQWNGSSLLERVKGLSTVSGGTITGAAYAIAAAKEQSFDSFYTQMKTFLEGDHVLNRALAKMEDEVVWKNTDKRQSLINAFSLAYAELLTNETFSLLRDKKSHLDDVCFNATEFSNGLAFRFQINGDFGNYRIDLNQYKTVSSTIKIADAVASSSCFPLGFAPMILPDDYLPHDSKTYQELKKLESFKNGIGLMDGGIVDNQGIGSTMLANKRRKENKYDLIMVCDVASYKMEPWVPDQSQETEGSTLKQLGSRLATVLKGNLIQWLVLLLGLGITWMAIADSYPRFTAIEYYLGGIITFCGLLLILSKWVVNLGIRIGLWFIRKWVEKLIPKFFLDKMQFVDDLKIGLMKRMLVERVTSGVKMVNEVFLKQIRRLNYDLLYKDSTLKNRRASVLIYQLTKEQFEGNTSTETRGEKPITGVPLPGPAIYACAQKASDMDTTLWFTPEDMHTERLKNLIACGQFTVCYSLIRYLDSLDSGETNSSKEEIQSLKAGLISDWKAFIENPFVLSS